VRATGGRPRRRSGIRWDRVGRFGLLAILFAIVCLYVSPLRQWITQSGTAAEHRRELHSLQAENRHLKQRARELQEPGALEREARGLGMVRRGERAYVIENP
jgi:cell division protein FtsB